MKADAAVVISSVNLFGVQLGRTRFPNVISLTCKVRIMVTAVSICMQTGIFLVETSTFYVAFGSTHYIGCARKVFGRFWGGITPKGHSSECLSVFWGHYKAKFFSEFGGGGWPPPRRRH